MISRIRLFSTSSLRQLASSAASAESPASTLLQDATKKSSPSTWARRSLRLVSPFELRAAYPKQTMPALFAMRARLGLGDLDLETLKDLCSLESTKRDQYAEKGKAKLDKVITDYLKPKYPNMPDLLIERARNSLNSESVLSSVAQDFGLAHAVVDERTLQLSQQIVFSIIGAVEEQLNSDQAIRLIKHHFLTRQIDWTNLIDFDYPEKVLEEITGEYYNTRPVTRLLNETGRQSPMPMFVVGVFAGVNKIGEGFGQSISLAQHRARMDALRKHFLSPRPAAKVDASYMNNK